MISRQEMPPIERFFARVNATEIESNTQAKAATNEDEQRQILQLRDRTIELLSMRVSKEDGPESIFHGRTDNTADESELILKPFHMEYNLQYQGHTTTININSSIPPSLSKNVFAVMGGKLEIDVLELQNRIVLNGTKAFIQKKETPEEKREANMDDLNFYNNLLDVIESHGTINVLQGKKASPVKAL